MKTPELSTSSSDHNKADAFLLGDILVQPALGLIGDDQVEPKAMQVLMHLISKQPNPVPVKDLLDAVWADSVVIENVVHQAIARLRRSLDDRSEIPKYIKTIPRQGYLLVASVDRTTSASTSMEGPAASTPWFRSWRGLGIVSIPVLVLAFSAYSIFRPNTAALTPQVPTVSLRALTHEEQDQEAQTFAQIVGQDIRDQLAGSGVKLVDQAEGEARSDYVVDGFVRRVDAGWRLSIELKESANGQVIWLESADLPADTKQFNRAPYVARMIEAAASTKAMTNSLPTRHPQTKEHYFAASMEWHKLLVGDNGNWQVAIKNFERTTVLEENFLPGHMFLAVIYANRLGGELDARTALPLARKHAEKVLSIDPRQTYIRGQVLIDLELAYDAARSYLEAAKLTQIPLGVIEEQLCKVEFTRGHFNKAIEHCRTALATGASPDQVSTLLFSAYALGAVERHSEALANYAEAANTRGDDLIVSGSIWQAALAAELNAVNLLIDMGDSAGALERLTELLPKQRTTAYPELFTSALAKLGRKSEARLILAAAEQRLIADGHVDNSAMFLGYHYLDDAAAAAPWLIKLVRNREWWTIGKLRGAKLHRAVQAQPLYADALAELAKIEAAAALIPLAGQASPGS